ncbi:MAG: cell division protein FtsH, partial [Rhodobacteraceae bacterium]|nr:cell division protein FtsH [Paracoccaceae bacterium]
TQQKIDAEVKRLVDEGYATATRILTERKDDLHRLAQGLLEYETLTGPEIQKVIDGLPLSKGDDGGSSGSGNAPVSIAAVPKTKPRSRSGGGMEPEPSA